MLQHMQGAKHSLMSSVRHCFLSDSAVLLRIALFCRMVFKFLPFFYFVSGVNKKKTNLLSAGLYASGEHSNSRLAGCGFCLGFRGCLAPRATNFQKKHNESIMAPTSSSSCNKFSQKTQGGHCGAPSSSQKKQKASPSSSYCNKFCQKNTRGAIVPPFFLLQRQILPKKHKWGHCSPPSSSCCSKHFKKTQGGGIPTPLFLLLKQMPPKKQQGRDCAPAPSCWCKPYE